MAKNISLIRIKPAKKAGIGLPTKGQFKAEFLAANKRLNRQALKFLHTAARDALVEGIRAHGRPQRPAGIASTGRGMNTPRTPSLTRGIMRDGKYSEYDEKRVQFLIESKIYPDLPQYLAIDYGTGQRGIPSQIDRFAPLQFRDRKGKKYRPDQTRYAQDYPYRTGRDGMVRITREIRGYKYSDKAEQAFDTEGIRQYKDQLATEFAKILQRYPAMEITFQKF